MGEYLATTPLVEEQHQQEEEDLIAAARNIIKALENKTNLTDDARKILANLGSQMSTISRTDEIKDEEETKENHGVDEIDHQLDKIQDKITIWENNQSMVWDYGPEEAHEYLKSVDEIRKLIDFLTSNDSTEDSPLLRKAHDILHTSMVKLEDEFAHLLVNNRQPFEKVDVSFRSTEDDSFEGNSVISSGDDSLEEVVHRDSTGRASEDYFIELVHPEVIPDLKRIANLMFDSDYGHECSQAFINVQKEALDDCLFILEVEKLSIEDVLKMEWSALNSRIRRWIWAMKIFVRVYLSSVKLLGDQIFNGLDSVFVESSKASLLQLLNFGEAITIGPHPPEKLSRILDMYEVLKDLVPDITTLYSDESGSCVRIECMDILKRLGDCAKATFLEFENAVACNMSANAFPGGGVHPLTKYVMNYIKLLTDYRKTLDEVLKDQEDDSSSPIEPLDEEQEENENGGENSPCVSPMAIRFRSLISILETNLDERSKLYRDDSLQNIFLMNNVHYMAERVKNSQLRSVLGDEWIRKHNWKFQQHAMSYERATWSSILGYLKEEGIQNPGSNSISRTLLKDRLQSFYLAFEEVYKIQTGWSIPDVELRDDLKISVSLKVVQACRTFVGRHVNHISEKHIKYSADDLEKYLMHFFEKSPKSLHGGHKK